jgi:hypothetical protein
VLRSNVSIAGLLAVAVLGCQSKDTSDATTCDRTEFSSYRTYGKTLAGDVDDDGTVDRVSVRIDPRRPPRCRHLLVVETRTEPVVMLVEPVPWPGSDPRLKLLAQIDGRGGLDAAVALSPAAVYRPGAVFTMHDGVLGRMRREVGAKLPDDLFPFTDEFPAGVDCAGKPGAIVVTIGNLAKQGRDDRHWDITRSFYRAVGFRFELVRDRRFRVEVGPEAKRRWPELRGDPFADCPGRVS